MSTSLIQKRVNAELIKALPERMWQVMELCDSTELPAYAGYSTDRADFLQQFNSVCASVGLCDALRPPARRVHHVPEQVRLCENDMLYSLIQAVFKDCLY